MSMRRHYFISDDLDELDAVEEGLEKAGVSKVQIHVMSDRDAEVKRHENLHEVDAFMKRDIVHSAVVGSVCGLVGAALVLGIAYFAGWTETAAGWIPFIFFAVVVLGFCTWEGGLYGIHKLNRAFARFPEALRAGKHIFFVDIEPREEKVLKEVVRTHPRLEEAGTGRPTPSWLVALRREMHELHKVFP